MDFKDFEDGNENNKQNLNIENIFNNVTDLKDFEETLAQEEQHLEGDGIDLSESVSIKRVKTIKKNKNSQKKGVFKAILWVFFIVAVSAGLAATVIIGAIDVFGIRPDKHGEVEVTIPRGATTQKIAEILHEADLIDIPVAFRAYSKFNKYDGKYNYGTYYLKAAGGYDDLCEALQEIGIQTHDVEVKIPERATIDQIAQIFEDNKISSKEDFKVAMNSGEFSEFSFVKEIPTESVYYLLEGYLYPETYRFFKMDDSTDGVTSAQRAIKKMLKTFEDKVFGTKVGDKTLKDALKTSKYSFHEIMTLASIIELEASGMPEAMRDVSAVFINRLEFDSFAGERFLGSTPTNKYISERYDTNKNQGLPPGPLCSPSLNAIIAAINPTDNKATYFVTDKKMKFYFTNSLSEHNSLVARLKRDGMWEY